jgi:hypothetical protein
MTAMRLPDGSTYCRMLPDLIGLRPIDDDSRRLQQEFLSMPALCLTIAQAARLLNVPIVGATRLLADLEHDGFLMRVPAGRYRLAQPPLS